MGFLPNPVCEEQYKSRDHEKKSETAGTTERDSRML